jgi:hypothetical protein
MWGFLFGLAAIAVYIGTAVSDGWTVTAAVLALIGLGIAIGGAIVGIVVRTTVGITAMWATLGALVAAVVELAQGDFGFAGALLLHAVSLFALQHFLAGTFRQHRPTPPRHNKPVWRSVPGYFGVISSTMADRGGPGAFTVFMDGSSEFLTTSGVRWSFEPEDWAGWRVEREGRLLAELPGLQSGKSQALVFTGSVAMGFPDVFVQPDDVTEWQEWIERHGIRERSR